VGRAPEVALAVRPGMKTPTPSRDISQVSLGVPAAPSKRSRPDSHPQVTEPIRWLNLRSQSPCKPAGQGSAGQSPFVQLMGEVPTESRDQLLVPSVATTQPAAPAALAATQPAAPPAAPTASAATQPSAVVPPALKSNKAARASLARCPTSKNFISEPVGARAVADSAVVPASTVFAPRAGGILSEDEFHAVHGVLGTSAGQYSTYLRDVVLWGQGALQGVLHSGVAGDVYGTRHAARAWEERWAASRRYAGFLAEVQSDPLKILSTSQAEIPDLDWMFSAWQVHAAAARLDGFLSMRVAELVPPAMGPRSVTLQFASPVARDTAVAELRWLGPCAHITAARVEVGVYRVGTACRGSDLREAVRVAGAMDLAAGISQEQFRAALLASYGQDSLVQMLLYLQLVHGCMLYSGTCCPPGASLQRLELVDDRCATIAAWGEVAIPIKPQVAAVMDEDIEELLRVGGVCEQRCTLCQVDCASWSQLLWHVRTSHYAKVVDRMLFLAVCRNMHRDLEHAAHLVSGLYASCAAIDEDL